MITSSQPNQFGPDEECRWEVSGKKLNAAADYRDVANL
jgi:hypothetical protein